MATNVERFVSVGLVLTVRWPPLAHDRLHNGVQVEPRLLQGVTVRLTQAALQHVEEGLPHHLKSRAKQTIVMIQLWTVEMT